MRPRAKKPSVVKCSDNPSEPDIASGISSVEYIRKKYAAVTKALEEEVYAELEKDDAQVRTILEDLKASMNTAIANVPK